MTQLSDTQLVILSKAAEHPERIALPLPTRLKGGAVKIVVGSLIKRGLLEEVDAKVRGGEAVWRETGHGHGVTLAITDAGLAAIGVEPESAKKPKNASKAAASKPPAKAPQAAPGAKKAKAAFTAAPAEKTAPKAPAGATERTPREGTKQATMIAMLQRKDGTTIAEIVEATGWQQHTVRGAFAGALKKKLGLTIVSEKLDGRGRVYRIRV
jgi:hypothetical protein